MLAQNADPSICAHTLRKTTLLTAMYIIGLKLVSNNAHFHCEKRAWLGFLTLLERDTLC